MIRGQVGGPAVARGEADAHVGVGDVGALGDEHDVAAHRDAGAEPDRGAVHGRDDGEVEPQHLVDQSLRVAQRLAPVLGIVVVADEPGDVAAGAERRAGAGEDDGPGLAVA